MITKEQWNTILEREGISDFLHAYCYEEFEGIGIYETDNDYYGTIFRIFSPPYPGHQTEDKIRSFLGTQFPLGSTINFFTMARSNVQESIQRYTDIHNPNNSSDNINIDNPEFLRLINEDKIDWIKKHANKSIFDSIDLEYNLRNFTTLVTVMVPSVKEDNTILTIKEMVSLFSKCKMTLDDFSPQVFSQEEYTTLMQEILNPHKPLWTPVIDKISPIKDFLFNNENVLKIEPDGTLSFGILKKTLSQTEDHEKVTNKENFLERMNSFINKTIKRQETTSDKMIDKQAYVKILGKKMFPYYLSISEVANLFQDFFAINISPLIASPFFVSLTIKIENVDKVLEQVNNDAKWNKYQLSAMGSLAEYSPNLSKRANEADMIIQQLDNGNIPMKAMWTLGIIDKDKENLDSLTAKVISEFKQKNWILQEESIIPLPIFLYSLPLQYDEVFYSFSKKFATLFDANISAITPFFSDSKGFGKEYLYYIGRNGQIQGFDIFDKHVTNKVFTIIAPPGGGKSFMTNDLIVSYLDVGTKIRVLDKGNSYKNICEMLGGEYVQFSNEKLMNFNFLSNISSDDNGDLYEDDINKFVLIVGKMAGVDLSISNDDTPEIASFKSVISSYIADSIRAAWEMGGYKFDEPGMEEVLNALSHLSMKQNEMADKNIRLVDEKLRDMMVSLKRFGDPSGEYYKYFNGKSTLNYSKSFVVFEMGDLDQKGELFKDLVIMIVTKLIQTEFIFGDKGQKKIMLIDEAWDLLKNKTTAKFIDLATRTLRKYNASMGVITQSINDFFMNEGVQVIFETAGWKIFLEQNDNVIRKAIEEKKLTVDEFTFKLLSSIETKGGLYGEILILSYKGAINIGRLLVGRSVYWLFTTDATEYNIITQMSNKHNLPRYVAAYIIGKVEENNTTFEIEIDAYNKKYEEIDNRKLTKELEDMIDEINND